MQHSKPAHEQLTLYRDQLANDLQRVEQNIYDLESAYFNAEHSQTGNVLKGFEGLLSTKEALRKRQSRGYKTEDRLFSLSSKSSPLLKELPDGDGLDLAPGGFGKKGYASKGYAQKGKR